MCLNPLKIKNNSLDYVKGRDADFYYVPCGKCYECQQAKRSDYTFRCIAEMLTTKSQVFYYTLTFNDEHLPMVIVDSPDEYGKDIMFDCFSKSLVQKFIKRLSKCLRFKYGIKLRYFVTSEFGEKFKRPHHHALFYCSGNTISPSEFRKLIYRFWSSPLSKKEEQIIKEHPEKYNGILAKHSYGFNKPGKYLGQVMNFLPLEYVAKYVSKDLSFYNALPINLEDYKNNVWTFPNVFDVRIFPYDEFKRECLPFTLMSVNFGCNIIDKFTFDNLVNSKYDVVDHLGKIHSYRIPMYMLRKCLYIRGLNENGNMHYMLNKLGYDVRKAQLDKLIDSDIVAFHSISNVIRKYGCRQIGLYAFGKDDCQLSESMLIDMFDNMDDDEIRLISQYRNFYRNKLSIDWSLDFDNDFRIYETMQTKLRKAPYFFEQSTIFEDCLDVLALEQICQIFDIVQKFLKRENAKVNIHNEQIFKRNYYGTQYIDESKEEVLQLQVCVS